MRKALLLIPFAAFAIAASPPTTVRQSPPPEASIPFADAGSVTDWRADGDQAVYFEDVHGQWYRADLMRPSFDLPFAEAIGIDSGPVGTLDRFGAIYVDGQKYQFQSFQKVESPSD